MAKLDPAHTQRGRVGVFGGSFDPIHNGHLDVARTALNACHLDRIVFMPAALQPHKPSAPHALGPDRLRMIELAIDGEPRFEASDIELRNAGVSYTINTIRRLKGDWPSEDIFFIVGADTLADLPRWREVEALLGLCNFVLVTRPGSELRLEALAPLAPAATLERMRQNAIRTVASPISSTDIRRRVRESLPIADLVPPAVETYIRDRNLYL